MKKIIMYVIIFSFTSIYCQKQKPILNIFVNGINSIRDSIKKTTFFFINSNGVIKGEYNILQNKKIIESGFIDNTNLKHYNDTIIAYAGFMPYNFICIGCKFKDSTQLYNYLIERSLKKRKIEEFYENGKRKSIANYRIVQSRRDTNIYESILIDTCFKYYLSGNVESINYLDGTSEVLITYYNNKLIKSFYRRIYEGNNYYEDYISYHQNELVNKVIYKKNGKRVLQEFQYSSDRKKLFMYNNNEMEEIEYNKKGKIKKNVSSEIVPSASQDMR